MYISQIPNVCILTFAPLPVFDENTFIVKITVNEYMSMLQNLETSQ